MQEACFCGRAGQVEDRELVVVEGKETLRCPDEACGHLEALGWLPEDARKLVVEEVEIDTLARRLRAETVGTDGVVKAPDLVGAWARKP